MACYIREAPAAIVDSREIDARHETCAVHCRQVSHVSSILRNLLEPRKVASIKYVSRVWERYKLFKACRLVLFAPTAQTCPHITWIGAYSSKRLSNAVLFIVFDEVHLSKDPDTEAIFSVVCSSDMLKTHTIIKRLRRISRLVLFVPTAQTCPSIE